MQRTCACPTFCHFQTTVLVSDVRETKELFSLLPAGALLEALCNALVALPQVSSAALQLLL